MNLTGALTINSASVLSLAYEGVANSDTITILQTTSLSGLPTTSFSSVLPASKYHVDFDVNYYSGGPAGSLVASSPTLGANIGNWDTVVIQFLDNSAVTPVTLDGFAARAEGAGVALSWTAVSEFKNAGFNVYRRAIESNEWVRVNPTLITGRITNPDAKHYAFCDWAEPGIYDYKLESVGIDGTTDRGTLPAGPVAADAGFAFADATVSVESVDAAASSIALAQNAERTAALAEKFAASPADFGSRLDDMERKFAQMTTVQPAPIAAAESDASRSQLPQVWYTNSQPSSGKAAMRELIADTPNSAPPVSNVPSISSAVAARWFSSTPAATPLGFAAAKIVYSAPGVLSIPQTSLPAGFDIRHCTLQREGLTLIPLALTADALIVYAPGYQDDYTDKDAIFLRSANSPTAAGTAVQATGLFDG